MVFFKNVQKFTLNLQGSKIMIVESFLSFPQGAIVFEKWVKLCFECKSVDIVFCVRKKYIDPFKNTCTMPDRCTMYRILLMEASLFRFLTGLRAWLTQQNNCYRCLHLNNGISCKKHFKLQVVLSAKCWWEMAPSLSNSTAKNNIKINYKYKYE